MITEQFTGGVLGAPTDLVGRRSDDAVRRRWPDARDVVVAAVAAPVRPITRPVVLLGGAVLLAEVVGLVVRLSCGVDRCGASDWAARLDMDALGSLPRALITTLLAAAAVVCLRGIVTSGRAGAGTWWSVVGLGCAVLALAKHTSVHSVVEGRLAGLLSGTDVQLVFVSLSVAGLVVVVVSGRWVRRETRAVVLTWLTLYAVASVGLAALTIVLGQLGTVVADLATFVEESAEGLAAVGLLSVLRYETVSIARRTAPSPARSGARALHPASALIDEESTP